MHKRLPIARVDMDESLNAVTKIIEVFNTDHMPLGVVKGQGIVDRTFLNEWWTGRNIPLSRSEISNTLERLHISSVRVLPLKGYGLSLSDQYWACPHNKPLEWDRINYFDNEFSPDVGLALFGKSNNSKKINLMSPDNTSDGWLKKRWVIMEGKRVLVKAGSAPNYQEPINEALASSICKRLDIPHIAYRVIMDGDSALSACEDFISRDTELVSAWYIKSSIKQNNSKSDYQHYIESCEKNGIKDTKIFLDKMLTVDFIIGNTDRHHNNFGAVRNAVNLEWMGHAPIYDSGTSLWHDLDEEMISHSYDVKSKPFRGKHSDQIKLVKDFGWFDIKKLNGIDEEFEDLLEKYSVVRRETRRDVLCGSLKKRVERLGEIAMERGHEMKKSKSTGFDAGR